MKVKRLITQAYGLRKASVPREKRLELMAHQIQRYTKQYITRQKETKAVTSKQGNAFLRIYESYNIEVKHYEYIQKMR